MILGISHIARTVRNIPAGYSFCEELPNHPAKFPFMSEPHQTHRIAFYPGKPAIELIEYPRMRDDISNISHLDSNGAICTALLCTNIEKDAKEFSDCFTTEAFPVLVNGRHLMVQLFRTKSYEFFELVQPCTIPVKN